MIAKFTYFTQECLLLVLFPLLLTLPLMGFRFGINTEIWPAIEVIFVYYLIATYQMPQWLLFFLSLLFDELYSMPLGINILAFYMANYLLSLTAKWIISKEYISNFVIFCGYAFVVMICRYFFLLLLTTISINLPALLLQYLTTIISYPVIVKLYLQFLIQKPRS